jgi:hypothetical protein
MWTRQLRDQGLIPGRDKRFFSSFFLTKSGEKKEE